MKSQLRGIGSWSHEVRTTEGRQKVVECGLVGQVDDGKSQAPPIVIAVKEIVIADCSVKQMPRRDAGWIMVYVERADSREDYSCRATGW